MYFYVHIEYCMDIIEYEVLPLLIAWMEQEGEEKIQLQPVSLLNKFTNL